VVVDVEKNVYFNSLKFIRDEKTGYYLCSRKVNGKRPRLHRYVWEFHNGEIPKGFHVHHIDHNKSNNDISNLELLDFDTHMKYHYEEGKKDEKLIEQRRIHANAIREQAKDWHKTEEGRKWHSDQLKKQWENSKEVTSICDNCKKTYTTNSLIKSKSKYCSNDCRSSARRKSGKDNEKRECVMCLSVFTTNKYSKAKTCSRKCAQRMRRSVQ
jgi:hypothetical protein